MDLSESSLSEESLVGIVCGIISGLGGVENSRAVPVELVVPPLLVLSDSLLERADVVQQAVELATELTDARANQLDPSRFAEIAAKQAQDHRLGIRVRAGQDLSEGGFGAISAIGRGSTEHPPVLIELWYPGAHGSVGPNPPEGAVGLAGKGVCFDSGGLSIKSAEGMYSMHTDCCGAASVLAAMTALDDLQVETPVYAVLPMVENLPGPSSVKPGDVITARNGAGVEIIDSDFEGRVVLADAVALLAESRPAAIYSFATLTYQIQIALGPDIAGLFARDATAGARMLRAAERSGEPLWLMPWATRYSEQLNSIAPGAQLRNHPLRPSGRAITAALFIGAFVPETIPFAHVDFAGPTVTHTPNGPAATGYGVRSILEVLTNWPGSF
ncbi:M17 family metallopeptidase [Galactobacter sp.]|uniref:M17 family metallopeptidase n=1 Tax=Galactobacter sp. TaxID=2676125 RepID=UPI0025BB4C69|nr:M17 family metallopeptidase [Galactobacter sp.]